MQKTRTLKLAIVQAGKTQREISRETGIPETRLSDLVRGWTRARPDEREKLARALGAPAAVLFDEPAPTAA
jgi:hypothetical protein